ncbi:hypothetical protein ACLB2K_063317 [Fragaria x ananassa]
MRMSMTRHPTAHKAFHDIVAIEREINALFVHAAETSTEVQLLMLKMAENMFAKFRKYFRRIEDTNQFLLVALVLDPRFKLKNITHTCLQVLQYSAEEAKAKANSVKELLVSLTDIYRTSSSSKSKKSKNVKMTGKMADLLEGWQKALAESDEVVVESEVDRYLLDPIEVPPKREADSWCLLSWWKTNGCKYPNLALVAKDVLAIQMMQSKRQRKRRQKAKESLWLYQKQKVKMKL